MTHKQIIKAPRISLSNLERHTLIQIEREKLFVMTVIQEMLQQMVRHCHKCCSQLYYVIKNAELIYA